MVSYEYIVERVDGDYVQLRRTDAPQVPLKLVARALVPLEVMEGNKLLYELLEYRIIAD